MKTKEIVWICLDLAKVGSSDDSTLNELHCLFLLKKYRSFLIKKEQEKEKNSTDVASEFEYQEICLDLERYADDDPCGQGYYLRSTVKLPKILEGITPRIYPQDFFSNATFTYVPRDRMRYVGSNKYMQNVIYASLGPDQYLYANSANPQFSYLKKVRVSAIFEDTDEAAKLSCDDGSGEDEDACDPMNAEFPIREYLVPSLIELVVKQLVGAAWRPKDSTNNAADDLADLAYFIRKNVKSALQKQMEE